MDFTTYLGFVAAALVVLAIPGPTILLVCAYAVSVGRKAALATALGVALGDLVAMTASLLGLGALLAASSFWFDALRYLGAAYLMVMGLKLLLTPAPTDDAGAAAADPAAANAWRMGAHAFAVTATNPKSILFFVAFLPQFLDPARALAPQMVILTATFVALATLNALLYAALAERAGRRLRTSAARLWANRLSGGALIGLGLAAALARRPL